MSNETEEISYYRAVEDHFAAARGVPHTLSPKDVQLLRGWWRDRVPLEAVLTAITEVFARRRERGEDDQPLSLGYCRHAVRRQTRALAEMRVGQEQGHEEVAPETTRARIHALRQRLEAAAAELPTRMRGAGELIRTAAAGLDEVDGLDEAMIEQHLYSLETTLVEGCLRALPAEDLAEMRTRAEDAAKASGATGKALERSLRAMLDRELRQVLGLPRLELG